MVSAFYNDEAEIEGSRGSFFGHAARKNLWGIFVASLSVTKCKKGHSAAAARDQ
jgi:hypothetical protein